MLNEEYRKGWSVILDASMNLDRMDGDERRNKYWAQIYGERYTKLGLSDGCYKLAFECIEEAILKFSLAAPQMDDTEYHDIIAGQEIMDSIDGVR
jgi:hypothetical protein